MGAPRGEPEAKVVKWWHAGVEECMGHGGHKSRESCAWAKANKKRRKEIKREVLDDGNERDDARL